MARFGYAACFGAGVLCCAAATSMMSRTADTVDPSDLVVDAHRAASAPVQNERSASPQARRSKQGQQSETISMEMIEHCLRIAEDIDAGMAHRLQEFCADDPEHCKANFMRVGGRLIELARLQDRDPELYEFKIETLRQDALVGRKAEQLRVAIADGDVMGSTKLESELRYLVQAQLVLTLRERGVLVQRLEAEVEDLRAELTDLALNFAGAVDQRIEDLKCGVDPVRPSWPTEAPADDDIAEASIE